MKIEYVGKCLCVEENGKKIFVVGDLHLGYEEVLNRAGVFVTRKMFNEMIDYFDKVFDKVGKVDYVVLLGDVKHYFAGVLRQERDDSLALFDYFQGKLNKNGEIIIVKGNHDNILEFIVKQKDGVRLMDYFIIGVYCFVHGDRKFKEMEDRKIKTWVMGHGHPAIKLREGVKTEKYKCFLAGKFHGKRVIIVPSFFEYIEGSDSRENDLRLAWNFKLDRFNVYVVSDEGLKVFDFGKLGKLR